MANLSNWSFLILMLMGVGVQNVQAGDNSKALGDGIKAAAGLLKTLVGEEGGAMFQKFAGMASKIGPFLGGLGPAMGLVSSFMPKESAELRMLKKEFAKINSNFDRVFSRFDEVTTAVQRSTMKVQYSKYERRITTLSGYLHDISQEKDENVFRFLKSMFLESYEQYYGDSADYLRLGMLKTGPFAMNIPEILVKSGDNDRGKIYKAMKSTLSLILQGVKVEYAYNTFTNRTDDIKYLKRDWDDKINKLLVHLDSVDQRVKNSFLEGARKDSEKMLVDYAEKDCIALSKDLYKLLSEKYSWRDWLVASYKAENYKNSNQHWFVTCNGFWIKKKHGKYLVVASVDQSVPKINKEKAVALLQKTKGSTKARVLIENFFPEQYKKYCAYGFLWKLSKKLGQFHIQANPDRTAYKPGFSYWKEFIFN